LRGRESTAARAVHRRHRISPHLRSWCDGLARRAHHSAIRGRRHPEVCVSHAGILPRRGAGSGRRRGDLSDAVVRRASDSETLARGGLSRPGVGVKGWGPMSPTALFALQFSFSLVLASLVARWYLWPRLDTVSVSVGLTPLFLVHALRYLPTSAFAPGQVDPRAPMDAMAAIAY